MLDKNVAKIDNIRSLILMHNRVSHSFLPECNQSRLLQDNVRSVQDGEFPNLAKIRILAILHAVGNQKVTEGV